MPNARKFRSEPDRSGHFGPYGGRFMPETLMSAVMELETVYRDARRDPKFRREFERLLRDFAGRPTPLGSASRLARHLGVHSVLLKREDLLHTGSHKINNTLGQVLLAIRMGKKRIIAETGAGQHGVATATVCALFGLECEIYMGDEDVHRQALNVFRMKLLGAKVTPVHSGSKTLKDAVNEAIRDWVTNVRTTHYIIGSVIGPHPYPQMVRDFQSVIGREALKQLRLKSARGADYAVACVGGGSNSIGLFHPFLKTRTRLIGVEASGHGLSTNRHAASMTKGRMGVLHGSRSELLQTKDGQVELAHSISAGLDYPGVGPEHAYLRSVGRAEYVSATDADALDGIKLLSRTEGIIPALEPAHAIGYLSRHKNRFKKTDVIVLCLSGRGDKDVNQVSEILKLK